MKAIMMALAVLGAAAAQAQNVQSVEQANAALAQVAKDRSATHAEFAASERECYTKFFVNNCLDKAKEKRRVALAAIRVREVDAEHFKRVDSVAKRDTDLAERARKDADEATLRAAQPPKPPKEEHTPAKPASGPRVAEREATHAANEKRKQQEETANAAQRAANVQAFERKKVDSERRQAEVKRKMAENAEKAKKAADNAEAQRKKEAAAQQAPAKQ